MEKKIRELFAANPKLTQAQVAVILGCSRQRVNQVCTLKGIKLADGRLALTTPLRALRPRTNHFGYTEQLRNPLFAGGASELTVAADLLRRGVYVYRSMTAVAAFDLVAVFRGVMYRIEVRSAKEKKNSRQLIFTRPEAGRYDILALVTPDAKVVYRPVDGVSWPLENHGSPEPKA